MAARCTRIPELIGHEKYSKNDGLDGAQTVVPISIVADTKLAGIIKEQALQPRGLPTLLSEGMANAFHHQSVYLLGDGLMASAHSMHIRTRMMARLQAY